MFPVCRNLIGRAIASPPKTREALRAPCPFLAALARPALQSAPAMPFLLLLSSVVAHVTHVSASEFATSVLDLNASDTLELAFALPSGFFSFTNDSGLFINVASGCDAVSSAGCAWSHATASGVYFLDSAGIAEILPRERVRVTLTVGYRSACASLVPAPPRGASAFRDGGLCFLPPAPPPPECALLPPRPRALRAGAFAPGRIDRRAPFAYAMRAQAGGLTRGLYALQPGDYVDVAFAGAFGFAVVSEPAGAFYANVAAGCGAAADARCVWHHSAAPRAYVVAGAQPALAQIVAVTAGAFQITAGYFDRLCCERIDAAANRSLDVAWDVPPGSTACFVHTARTGAMAVRRVVLGAAQRVIGYDFHALRKAVTVSVASAIAEADGIGAVLFDNRRGDGIYAFSAEVRVSDPDDTRLDLGFVPLDRALRFRSPTELTGEQHGFADRPLDPGGCVGVVCPWGRTEVGGNTGGVPAESDGDPIYEDDSEPENSPIALAIAISILILFVGIGLFLACSCWRKSAMEEAGGEPLASDDENECGGAYELPEKIDTEETVPIECEGSVYGGTSMVYATEPGVAAAACVFATSVHGVWCL
jgi:hypothetical protein